MARPGLRHSLYEGSAALHVVPDNSVIYFWMAPKCNCSDGYGEIFFAAGDR